MKRFPALFTVLALMLGLWACTAAQPDGQSTETPQAPTWQEQYDLGVRYLSEGNYQEAILAFTAAIEIDPKRAPAYVGRGDAYVKSGETAENLAASKADYEKAIELDETIAKAYLALANIYIGQGNYEEAMEILQQALENADEKQSIADKIAEIETAYISNMERAGDYSFLFSDDFMSPQDWTVNGKPIYKCKLDDFQAEFPHGDYDYPCVHMEGDGWTYIPEWPRINDDTNVIVNKLNGSLSYTIYLRGQADGDVDFFFQPNLRGIATDDSFSEILEKIGFSTVGIQYLESTRADFDYTLPDSTLKVLLRNFDNSLSDKAIYLNYYDRASNDIWYTINFYFSFSGKDLYTIYCSYDIFYPGGNLSMN